MQKETYTQDEVAAMLGVSRASVRRAVKKKLLTPVYGGLMCDRIVGITKDSVAKLIARRQELQAQNSKGKEASRGKKAAVVR